MSGTPNAGFGRSGRPRRLKPAARIVAEPGKRRTTLARVLRIGRGQPVLRAVIVFGLLMGLFYGFVHTPRTKSDLFQTHLGLIATVTGAIVNLFGYQTTVVDTSVTSSVFSMQIVRGCDAIEPTAALVSAILASPVSLWPKIPGILIGTLTLLLINLVRLVSLFFIGVHFPKALDIMHEDVWQAAFIVLAIVLWAMWVQWATRGKREQPDASG